MKRVAIPLRREEPLASFALFSPAHCWDLQFETENGSLLKLIFPKISTVAQEPKHVGIDTLRLLSVDVRGDLEKFVVTERPSRELSLSHRGIGGPRRDARIIFLLHCPNGRDLCSIGP
jgi:hypothetical protein